MEREPRCRVLMRQTSPLALVALGLAASCQDASQPSKSPQVESSSPATEPTVKAVPEAVAEPAPSASAPAGDPPCLVNPDWFSHPSRAVGANFPSKPNNCDFHLWAIQTFTWLASDDGKTFLGFANPKDLFVPTGPTLPYPGRKDSAGLQVLARFTKSAASADIEDIFQAGAGNEILIDQQGQVVYYGNHLDDRYWDFISSNRLYELAVLKNTSPALDFSVDSIELKTSWRVAERNGKVLIPNAAQRFFVVDATIPVVEFAGSKVKETKKRVPAKMALVGMHVVGVVEGHPEFIWGTFEHADNAPNCTSLSATNPGTGQPWSFYDGKAPASACNQFDPAEPSAAANVCRLTPEGGGSTTNQNNVTSLSKQLVDGFGSSVWSNYRYAGAVWTTGVVPLNNPRNDDLRGSLQLANTSLETFKQDTNCLSCHNGGAHEVSVGIETPQVGAKNINLSHFVVNYQAAQEAKR